MDRYPISICMAGAVSAGTYSAGVMEILLEALRRMEGAEVDPSLLPKHKILIRGMSGASAGSVQAALSSLDMFAASNSQNLGYKAWTSTTAKKLLTTPSEEGTVKSVLNSEVLGKITEGVIKDHDWGQGWPAFISPYYELRLSITNLRGVPYNLRLPKENLTEFGMSQHNEYLRFRFIDKNDTNTPRVSTRYSPVEVGDRAKADLNKLTIGALASSAFPFAFAPVKLQRPTVEDKDIHDDKSWLIADTAQHDDNITTVNYNCEPVQPVWKQEYGVKDTLYAVDGGVTNNEPLLEAFKLLYGDDITDWANLKVKANPDQTDEEASEVDNEIYDGRVILIDPFPNSLDMKLDGAELRIDKQAGALKSAVIRHARFSQPLMVSAKLKNRVGSVYPSNPLRQPRPNSSEREPILPLKSGAMGGFAGFLKQDFLKHDYELGRLNMMRFLRYHFTVPVDHPLVKDDANYIAQWAITRSDNVKVVPIIPVFMPGEHGLEPLDVDEEAKEAFYRDALSRFSETFDVADRTSLEKSLRARFNDIGTKLIGVHKSGSGKRYDDGVAKKRGNWFSRSKLGRWAFGGLVNTGWKYFGKSFLADTVLETIENSLAKQGLLGYKVYQDGKQIGGREGD